MNIFEKASELNRAGRYDEALPLYDACLTHNYDSPNLLSTVGTIFLREPTTMGLGMALLHSAKEKYESRKEPVPSEVYNNLAVAYKITSQVEKAKETLEKAVAINPTAATLTSLGGLSIEGDDPEKGEKYLRQAIELAPDDHMPKWNLSLLLLETGRFAEGFQLYEAGLHKDGMRPERLRGGVPRWEGQKGTVLVSGEQGLGDEIMFASILPELMKTNEVILECHPRLKTLFEKSFGIRCYGTRKDKEVFWVNDPPQFDYRLMIGSLGRLHRTKIEDFPGKPYLKAEPLPKGRKFRVGISWTGGRLPNRIEKRTVPLNYWRQILNQDCEFVSLQYTDSEQEVEYVNKLGYSISLPPQAKAKDYYETAQLVASCDLVISVCTSVVHLAGALGVPCWVMVPKNPAWRYQREGHMPWYRSVRLYRQPSTDHDSWFDVVGRIALDLEQKLRKAA